VTDEDEHTPVDDVIAADEFTPVIPARNFAADSLRALGDSFEGSREQCRAAADLVGDDLLGDLALAELAEKLREHAQIAAGCARAIERVRAGKTEQNGG